MQRYNAVRGVIELASERVTWFARAAGDLIQVIAAVLDRIGEGLLSIRLEAAPEGSKVHSQRLAPR